MDARPPVRAFMGCASYQTLEPLTAVSREAVLRACTGDRLQAPPSSRLAGHHPVDLVGCGYGIGYGAGKNIQTLVEAADGCGADVLVYHDADVRFTVEDFVSVCDTWARFGPQALVGTVYPSAHDDHLVGVMEGVPSEGDSFTRREDLARELTGEHVLAALQVGFGLVAIPIAFFRARAKPWFRDEFLGEQVRGPDSVLCAEFRAAGWMIVADLRARPMHRSREWRRA